MSNLIYTYYACVSEGPLYSIDAEDGPATTFSCCVDVLLVGGRYLRHETFHSIGHCYDEDGLCHVARSRDEAQAFADRVNARGYINLDHWFEVPQETESLEERFAGYAREEQIERSGGRL